MPNEWPEKTPDPVGGAIIAAAMALLLHAFVFAILLVVVTSLVVRVGAFYEDMELSLREGVVFVLKLASMVHRWWFLLLLPMAMDVALVLWLASKPARRWLLPLLNYLWLGGALLITTLAFSVMVSPLFRLMPN